MIEADLKLQPLKCHFMREEITYLGHVITNYGLKTNPQTMSAMTDLPIPSNLAALRQFLGLTSDYHWFIAQYAKFAHPLHSLTKKEVTFKWSSECQNAFDRLKEKLVSSPILCYPDFYRDFVLETDVSVKGLGAVLSQEQDDKRLHPVAYASGTLTPSKNNYSITELETLAVVWVAQRFHTYLYDHKVLILTGHSVVKAILGAPGCLVNMLVGGQSSMELDFKKLKSDTDQEEII